MTIVKFFVVANTLLMLLQDRGQGRCCRTTDARRAHPTSIASMW